MTGRETASLVVRRLRSLGEEVVDRFGVECEGAYGEVWLFPSCRALGWGIADFTWCVSVNAASISSSSCLYGRSLQCTVLIRKAEAIPHARKLLHACDERPLSDGCTATSPHYQLCETRQRPRILRRPCLAGYHIKRIPIARSQCCVPARRRCGSKLAVMGGLSGERPAPGERTISNERVVTDDNAHGRREKKGYWTVEDVFEPLWTNLAFAGAEARAEVPTLALRRRTLALVTLELFHRHATRIRQNISMRPVSW